MNFFDFSFWKSSESLLVIEEILCPLFKTPNYSFNFHDLEGDWKGERLICKFNNQLPYEIVFVVEEPSWYLFQTFIEKIHYKKGDTRDTPVGLQALREPFISHRGSWEFSSHCYRSEVSEYLPLLCKGMYFLGYPIHNFVGLELNAHERIEWPLQRREAWTGLGDIFPNLDFGL